MKVQSIGAGFALSALLLVSFGQPVNAAAQGTSEAAAEPCVLRNNVFTCDLAAFQKTLAQAKSVSIETHSVDKLAQSQLKDLILKKLGKTLVPDGSPADLIFLLIPTGVEGMSMSPGQVSLGTLRVYSVTPDGARARLLWAEVFSGQEDLPWPAVVHSLIAQFQGRLRIK